ncbi:MAG: hypothetical protein COA65_09700 [Rhodospirillaceae bacterium]|nr:MAG: hypothetical protein COA65_09700 [Rhodospirillaceae bacterium]
MKGFCKKYNITEYQFTGKEEIGGSLYLRNLTSIPEGFNPTVGGSLYLRNLTSIHEGFNPTVGGSLYLSSLTSIHEGFNPTVGGSLYLRSGLSCETKPLVEPIPNPIQEPLTWKDGKYILIDDILSEIVKRRGNALQLKGLSSDDIIYAVTNGEFWAHGETLKQAKKDLIFKIVSQKLKNEPIYPNTMMGVNHFRLITGACDIGIRRWMKHNGIPFKIANKGKASEETVEVEKIKASKLLELLKKTNAYGLSDFEKLYNLG